MTHKVVIAMDEDYGLVRYAQDYVDRMTDDEFDMLFGGVSVDLSDAEYAELEAIEEVRKAANRAYYAKVEELYARGGGRNYV